MRSLSLFKVQIQNSIEDSSYCRESHNSFAQLFMKSRGSMSQNEFCKVFIVNHESIRWTEDADRYVLKHVRFYNSTSAKLNQSWQVFNIICESLLGQSWVVQRRLVEWRKLVCDLKQLIIVLTSKQFGRKVLMMFGDAWLLRHWYIYLSYLKD